MAERKPSILVVDDIRENLLHIKEVLKNAKAKIFSANGHVEAMEIAKNTRLALIILDVEMPEVNGFELAKMIRETEINRYAPLIFLSAVHMDEFSIFKGYSRGAVDYLTKPLNVDILQSKVRVFIELDRVRSELADSRRRYSNIIEDQTDLIFRVSPDFSITFANKAFANVFNKDMESILGSNMFDYILSADLEVIHATLSKLNTENTIQTFEHRLDHPGNAQIWVSHIIRSFYDDEGNLLEFQSVCRDISEVKQNISTLLEERDLALKLSQNTMEFLTQMSHEIRTPMSGIVAMAEMLNNTPVDETQSEAINIICSSASNLVTILNELLDYSKIEAGKISITPQAANIRDVVQESVRLFTPRAIQKGLRIGVDFDENLPGMLIFDALRYQQIIINLLNNALKFTRHGGINLYLSGKITKNTGFRLQTKVKDTGIGMPEDHIDELFKPFVQAGNDTLTKGEGTGLGLAICKKLTELMNGDISVTSKPGIGSEFVFHIETEISLKPEEKSALKTATSYINSKALNVLLVEDNLLNQKVAAATLRKLGHEFIVAENGLLGVEKYKTHPFDLVIMDIQMPVMNGLDATRQIRAWETENNLNPVTIIALTANALSGDRLLCLQAGMNDYLSKPFKFNEFAEVINKNFGMAETEF
ncbi:MAG: response regulator [Bacteroidales bacterium]|jgi:PAS domain S-box-containing protein|nr:response regulator [Bacteroidales bacterium]